MPENITPNRREARANARSPFVFDVRELGRRAGAMQEFRRSVPAPAGLGLEIIEVPEGAPLALDIRLESVTEGVLVTGTISGPLRGECGRCLEPVSENFAVEICELFAYPDSATDETTEQDEVRRLEKDLLDLEPVVRDLVVLGLPWTPLCGPDCSGLCPTCGERLDDLPAGHTHEVLDPRWAALASFAEDAAPGGAAPESSDQPD
ncbi:MAG TPA: YceD family protein [Jatrophihabitantaceae bacterium]|jgi:uncharacterized protein|nr:YceD family protein [Jatrophihabitantaceae bacterium]